MKIIALISSFITVMYSCSEQTEQTAQQETKDDAPIESACVACRVNTELNAQKMELSLHLSTNRYPDKIKLLKNSIDSLNTVYTDLLLLFYNSADSAIEMCSKKYNLHFISDTKKRDSLFADYYSWTYFNAHPIVDTTGGYIPPIVNGLYQVKKKGKLYPMSSVQYEHYVQKGLEITGQLRAHVLDTKTSLASQITGLPEEKIDAPCLEVLNKKCNYASKIAQERTTLTNDSVYQKLLGQLMNL